MPSVPAYLSPPPTDPAEVPDWLKTAVLVINTALAGIQDDLSRQDVVVAQRLAPYGGSELVEADFDLTTGPSWGATASVSAIATGATDARGRFTVTSAGAGQAANPLIVLTFRDGDWLQAPFVVVGRNGGAQPAVLPTWSVSASALTITFPGTPVDTETYTFEFVTVG